MLGKERNMEILKVSSKTEVKSLAGAIAGIVRTDDDLEVQAIGAGAVNQAIKAIATARGFLAPGGIDIVCTPSFDETEITTKNGIEPKTLIKLRVDGRYR